jgi:hypothetical protein
MESPQYWEPDITFLFELVVARLVGSNDVDIEYLFVRQIVVVTLYEFEHAFVLHIGPRI